VNVKALAIGILLGIVGAYILALASKRFGPLPGLK